MMTGTVTADGEAVLSVQVRALGGRPENVKAVIDTGFSEFLALSHPTIARLGLPYRGELTLTLANGREEDFAVYRAIVEWHGHARPVPVVATDAGALVGMALLHGNRLTMDIFDTGPLRIEPIPHP